MGGLVKTILCFGDSNTWGSATRPDLDRYALAERWPGVLQARLGSDWNVIAEGLPGRTTVRPDPIDGLWMNGADYLMPCLKSHRPLDAVAIMLGTNDLKHRFGATPGDIAGGVGVLLKTVKQSESGPGDGVPKMMVICPAPILRDFGVRPDFSEMFAGGYEKSLRLAPAYAAIAREHGAAFLNAGEVMQSSAFDGIHLDPDAHLALGNAVAASIAGLGW